MLPRYTLKCLFLFCTLIFFHTVTAQNCEVPTLTNGTFLHGNNVRALYAASGSQLWDGSDSQFGIETNSMVLKTIFAQGLWMVGYDPAANFKLSATTYGAANGESDYYPGPLPLVDNLPMTNPETCSNFDRAWSVFRYEIEAHQADFADNGIIDNPLPSIIGWPGKGNPEFEAIYGFGLPETDQGYAPFWDLDADGVYEPLSGEYPIEPKHQIIPEHMVWTIFNTYGNFASDSGSAISNPTEIQCLAWALNCTDNEQLNNTIFTNYTLIQRGIESYDSVRIGLWTDFDLGCYTDDYVGSAPELNTYYAYNQDNDDNNPCDQGILGAGENPPVQAVTFLNRPLNNFIYANAGFGLPPGVGSPNAVIEYARLLSGRFIDGTPISTGGTGYNPASTDEVAYAFPDNPNDSDGWSAFNESLPPSDWRSIGSTFIEHWDVGQVIEFDIAHSYFRADGANFLENVNEMYEGIPVLQALYDDNFAGSCARPLICDEDCVWSGDLNADGIANHEDIIALGFGFESSGSLRSGPYNWTPQSGDSWGDTQVFGPDLKHLDANGDGTSSLDDREYIIRHYNFTQPGYEAVVEYPEGDELEFVRAGSDPALTELMPGESMFARARLAIPITDLRAIAFTLEYDPAFFSAFNPIGGNGDFSILDNSIPGLVDIGAYEIDPDNSIGGIIQQFQLRIRDEFPDDFPSDESFIRFRNIRGYDSDGNEIDLGARHVKVQVEGAVGTTEPTWASGLDLYPNPVQDQLQIGLDHQSIEVLHLFDGKGRLLRTIEHPSATIDVRALPSGLYYARIHLGDEFVYRKFVKQ